MRLLKAQWTSKCAACGRSVLKDSEASYDDEARKIYHPKCAPPEPDELFANAPDPRAIALADELGFLPHESVARAAGAKEENEQ